MSANEVNEQVERRGVHKGNNAGIANAPILPPNVFVETMIAKISDGSIWDVTRIGQLADRGIKEVLPFIEAIYNSLGGIPALDLTNNHLNRAKVDELYQFYADLHSQRLTDSILYLEGNASAGPAGRAKAAELASNSWGLRLSDIPTLTVTECGEIEARGIYTFTETGVWENGAGFQFQGADLYLAFGRPIEKYHNIGDTSFPWEATFQAVNGAAEPVPVVTLGE